MHVCTQLGSHGTSPLSRECTHVRHLMHETCITFTALRREGPILSRTMRRSSSRGKFVAVSDRLCTAREINHGEKLVRKAGRRAINYSEESSDVGRRKSARARRMDRCLLRRIYTRQAKLVKNEQIEHLRRHTAIIIYKIEERSAV